MQYRHTYVRMYIYYVVPVVKITSLVVQCRYIYLSWTNINSGRCGVDYYRLTLRYRSIFGLEYDSSTLSANHTYFMLPDNITVNVSLTSATSLHGQSIGNIDKTTFTIPAIEGTYVHT